MSTCAESEAHGEYEGEVVVWGANNIAGSAAECCAQCEANAKLARTIGDKSNAKPCTTWVWCADEGGCGAESAHPKGECWLKHHVTPWRKEARARGPGIGWTSGAVFSAADAEEFAAGADERTLAWLRSYKDDEATVAEAHGKASRVCGSPAIDGYAHVDPECLERSPTAAAWRAAAREAVAAGAKLSSAPYEHEIHTERHASYDGLAVAWGLTHMQPSAEACAAACAAHVPGPGGGAQGPFRNLPCNVWVWCPSDFDACFEPDAHAHKPNNCWLKFSEAPEWPEVNQRGSMAELGFPEYRKKHTQAPELTQWVSGTVLPKGVPMTNGTWGPRAQW